MGRSIERFKYVDQAVLSALILGFAALGTDIFSRWLFPDGHSSIGALFLFWAAASLAPFPTLVAAGVGVIPEVFWHGDYQNALRLMVLCCAISYVATRKPRIPIFATTLVMWFSVFIPVLFILSRTGISNEPFSPVDLGASALEEMMLAMIVGVLLLNNSIWSSIRHQPRHVSIPDLLMHVVPLTVTVVLFLALSRNHASGTLINFGLTPENFGSSLALVVVSVCATTLLSWHMGKLFEQNMQHFLSHSLMQSNAPRSFSGLSSYYWRRHSVTSLPRYALLGDTENAPQPTRENKNARFGPEQGICAVNKNKTIAFLNRQFRDIADIRDNDPLGKPLDSVSMHPQIKECLNTLVERTLSKGPKTVELKLNHLPSKLRFIEVCSKLAGTEHDSTLDAESGAVILCARDITERRAVEYHLLKGQRLSSLSNLVRGISHSFNNAMASIIGQASAARYSFDEVKVKQSLEQIVSSAHKAGMLVRQILDFADAGPSQSKQGDVSALVQEHLNLLKKIVGEKIEIHYDPPEQPLLAVFERNLLLQVITNVIINSREAIGDASGTISITLKTEEIDEAVADLMLGARPGDFVRLAITDNGSGMNSEVLARAFEPLFTTKTSSGNPGLGLSVVFGIVRSMDGFLSLESHVGKGTTVSIYLPLTQDLHQQDPAEPTSTKNAVHPKGLTPTAKGTHERILVVEDDQNVREVVAAMLTTLGYQVSSCSNGQEALQACSQSRFDLVLTDMIMPKMNGLELIKELRSKANTPKALIMTAYGVTQESLKGETKLIAKPFDIDSLAQTVRELLDETGKVVLQ
ncbi:MAG: response regulator [Deltaproteobacteria bacterium]|nr:response regulator [Deltaproteobacteria bacterium]